MTGCATADNSEVGINLGSIEGQQALEPHLDGVDVLILDNLSTLMTTGSEGASDSWLPMQNWLLRLRRKGIAVLLIHHAGVNGKQRGTSRREDTLDTVISLRRPADYSHEQGARFEVHIEKARMLVGEGATPFEAAVESFTTEGGKSAIRWTARDLKPSILPVKLVVYTRADDIFSQRDCSGSANRQGHCASDLAKIDEEIFGFVQLSAKANSIPAPTVQPPTTSLSETVGCVNAASTFVSAKPPVAKTRIRSNA
jgi:hypothetical protein